MLGVANSDDRSEAGRWVLLTWVVFIMAEGWTYAGYSFSRVVVSLVILLVGVSFLWGIYEAALNFYRKDPLPHYVLVGVFLAMGIVSAALMLLHGTWSLYN